MDVALANAQTSWSADDKDEFTNLTIRRSGEDFTVKLRLVRVGDLVEREWQYGPLNIVASDTRHLAPAASAVEDAMPSFSSGVKVRENGGEFVVIAVLRGSSAYRNGVKPGDRVVSINGNLLGGMPQQTVEKWLNAYAQTPSVLGIRRGDVNYMVRVHPEGMSRILDRAESSAPVKATSL